MCFKRLFIVIFILFAAHVAFAQSCPENIGFEDGTFKNWKCYIGTLQYGVGAEDPPTLVPPDGDRHKIYTNTSPQELDPYGNFPVNCPNGSNHSIRLGNSTVSGNGQTRPAFYEKITYDFIVPSDDYTLICYYAVVFQDFNHAPAIQPKLIANVHNLDDPSDDNKQCGNFNFTAQAGLQGFQRSNVDRLVYYKPWSALVMKISNRKGKHFQLEFITHDCAQGAHFGYAYLDFNETNCQSPIMGNQYCAGQNTVSLTAPPGFQMYSWTDANGTEVSNTPTLKISPPPPDGTVYNLHITPYAGLGCENAFSTTIQKNDVPFVLQVQPNLAACRVDGIDITQPAVTAGSSPGMKFDYYTDADAQNFVSDPKRIVESGDYYIRGTNSFGCTDLAKIHLDLYDGAVVAVRTPLPVCAPATTDLTTLATTTEPGVTFSYYTDAALTIPVVNPQAINRTGTYYIKVTSFGVPCITVRSVEIIVSPLPTLSNTPINYTSCPPLDLNKALLTLTSGDNGSGISYMFYKDAAATVPVPDPANITLSGNYYYKAINVYGCESANKPLIVATVVLPPTFTVTDPTAVVYPQTIDLSFTHIPLTYATFTYWLDAAATKPLINYTAIGESGTFYIKAVNAGGCAIINPVHVLVNAPPEADMIVPNTFTPNGDGINDEFKPITQGVINLNYIKIFNRYGKEIFETKQLYNRWDGSINGKPEPAGTYYWVFSAYDIYRKKIVVKSGSVTIIR